MIVDAHKRLATTTIRVSVQTRDRLAEEAKREGKSLAALLERYAWQAEREAFFASEREASSLDALNAEALAEQDDWQQGYEFEQ